MLIARRVTRTLLIDLAFAFAAVVALVLCVMSLRVSHAIDLARSGGSEALLLFSEMRVPIGVDVAYVRGGWRSADVAALESRLGPETRVGSIGLKTLIVDVADRRVAVSLATLTAETLSILLPTAVCRTSDIMIERRDAHLFSAVHSLRVADRQFSIQSADLLGLRLLLPSLEKPLAVVCGEVSDADPIPVVVASGPSAGSRIEAISTDQSLFKDGLFGSRLSHAPLGISISRSIDQNFPWVAPAGVLSGIACVLLFAAWGSIRGLKERGELQVRRILGGTRPRLAILVLARAALPASLAILTGLVIGVTLDIGRIGSLAATSYPAVALATVVLLCLLAIWAARCASSSVWKSGPLNTNAASATSTIKLWPYLLAWAACLAVIVASLGVAMSIGRHLQQVEGLRLGYEPRGLHVIGVTVEMDQGIRDNLAELQMAVLSASRSLSAPHPATLICNAPWDYDNASKRAEAMGTGSADILIGAGPDVLDVLQVSQRRGRDFDMADMGGSRLSINQNLADSSTSAFERKFIPVGEIGSLHLGSLLPTARKLSIAPIFSIVCEEFSVLVRLRAADALVARELAEELRLKFPRLAIGDAVEAHDKIVRDRAALYQLLRIAGLAGVLGVIILAAFGGAFIAAYFSAQRRELAIRQALGESSIQAAIVVTKRLSRWSVASIFAGLFCYLLAISAFGSLVVDFNGIGLMALGLMGIGIAVAGMLAMAIVVHRKAGNLPLRSALMEQ